jgi:hypothetical protein
MERTKDFRKLAKRMLMVGGVIVIALVLLVIVSSNEGEAATINVPGDYPTITQAITAANNGDAINVGTGTYNEHLAINKSLTFSGAGFNVVTIDGEHVINASNVQLDGFTFKNTDDYTITIDATSGSISNIQVINSVLDLVVYSGVHIGGDLGSSNLISNVAINSNTFYGPPSMGSNPFKIGGLFGAPADQPVDNLDFTGRCADRWQYIPQYGWNNIYLGRGGTNRCSEQFRFYKQ